MNNSNKHLNFVFIILSILPLIMPILNIYLGIILTANIMPNEVVYYGSTSLFTLILKIFLFSLAIDAVLSLLGFNSDSRISLLTEKKFTAIVFETSLSIFTLLVGYSSIRYLGLTDCIFFRSGLALFVGIASLLDLSSLFFIGKALNNSDIKDDTDEKKQ